MGLDMYLYVTKYESKGSWSNDKTLEYPEFLKELETKIFERNFLSVSTKYQVGYWRKFNALHNYIVEKFANGEDHCQEIYIGEDGLKQILNICKKVHEDLKTCPKTIEKGDFGEYEIYESEVAKELLPPASGFFFGSLKIDEWYKQDIEYTIELCEDVLKVADKVESIIYDASW